MKQKIITVGTQLRGLDTHGRFSTILCKGKNFCDALFAYLHTKSLLKKVLF